MGTFLGYYGGAGIPENRREEFSRRVLKILDHGGMMRVDEVSLYGRKIDLLSTPEADMERRRVHFSYNYFENARWETAGYHMEDGSFVTGKVGTGHFNVVCCAVYVLSEFYDSEFRISEENGIVYNATGIIGWLNYLFGEQYTNARIHDLWKIYNLLPDDRRNDDLLKLLTTEDVDSQSQFGVLKYLAAADHELFHMTLSDGAEKNVSVATLLFLLKESVDELMAMDPPGDLDTFKSIIADGEAPEMYKKFANVCMLLPREFSVKFVADAFGLDFMKLWAEMKPQVRLSPDINDGKLPHPPVQARTTAAFLNRSDDDRAWWWRPDGDVHFSGEMEDWLRELKRELDGLAAGERLDIGDFIRLLVETLYEVGREHDGAAAFRDMFYEFLEHPDDIMIQAAIRLLGQLKERYLAENTSDEFQKLRRYLAVLGNRELRNTVFGF